MMIDEKINTYPTSRVSFNIFHSLFTACSTSVVTLDDEQWHLYLSFSFPFFKLQSSLNLCAYFLCAAVELADDTCLRMAEKNETVTTEAQSHRFIGPPPQPWLPFIHSNVIVDFRKKSANNQGCYRRFQRLEECLMEAPIIFDEGGKALPIWSLARRSTVSSAGARVADISAVKHG
ncbi:hypothetical protein L2E82_03019 [Cichorium intybus]|uniref:Uncharacterized protein n=1 Tax=Cichorium intybus TaxID=13427 RepID=A0ACB9H2V8_CICIN|nr:hypothetical protein L2E82_03019 [Cichorium intybus]